MVTRWSTFLVWALVAASAVYWGLHLFGRAQPVPEGTRVATNAAQVNGDLSRLLGAEAPAPELEAAPAADPRFQLLGVLSARGPRAEREGVALIAVDDRPPRAYRVGMVVDGDTVLQAVHPRGANLGPSGGLVRVALELPPPAPPATGALPGLDSQGAASGLPPSAALRPAGNPSTQVFMPPGQPAPSFTRNRAAPGALAPVAPPSAQVNLLPAPPPALPTTYGAGQEPLDPNHSLNDETQQAPDEGPNPLR